MPEETFNTILTEAVREYIERGFSNIDRLNYWTERLRRAALVTAEVGSIDQITRRHMEAILKREIDREGLLKYHKGVPAYRLKNVRPKLRSEVDRRVRASADLIKLDKTAAVEKTIQRFSGWVTSVPPGGTRAADRMAIKAEIRKPMASLSFQERRVLIDQGHKLISNVSEIVALDNGALAGHWVSHYEQPGYNYRKEHKHFDVDDKFFVVRNNWAIAKGLMTSRGYRYTDEIEKPGELVFCLPGDVRIPFANGVEIAYKRWYSGDLTEIITHSGKTLRATPNHPILTIDGWKKISALTESDYVIEISNERINGIMSELHDDYTIPTIAEVFGTCNDAGKIFRERGRCHQFHGDGTESDVDIVRSARLLTFAIDASFAERFQQFGFAVSDLESAATGAVDFLGHGSDRSRTGSMRGIDEIVASILSDSSHANSVSLAYGATLDTHSGEHLVNRQARNTQPLRDRLNAFSGIMRMSNVISVNTREWSGHVYNLQTVDGTYIADGIVTHNCRCYYVWIYNLASLPDDMLTAKGKAVLMDELV